MKRSRPIQSSLEKFATKRVKVDESEEEKEPKGSLKEILTIEPTEFEEKDFEKHFKQVAQYILN